MYPNAFSFPSDVNSRKLLIKTDSSVLVSSVTLNSIVAIGMIGCKSNKNHFLRGYYQMLERIEPEAIICFGDPFDEMEGNIIVVDYLKSRKEVR